MTNNSSVNFKFIPFYFGQKDPIKVLILTLSSALVKNCQISHAFFQTTDQSFFKICVTPQCHDRQLLCTFVAETIYTFVTRSQLKQNNFLDFSRAPVKICEVHVNFKTTSQFLLNFCVALHCHDTQLHCKFEAHAFSTLEKKILSKFQF